jgi:hypothetical protein
MSRLRKEFHIMVDASIQTQGKASLQLDLPIKSRARSLDKKEKSGII